MQREHQTYIIGAFAAALRRREFSKPDEKSLVASTVQEAVAKSGEIFRANVGYNPTHGVGSQALHPLLTRQFKGMQNLDPGEKQQKALPVSVYRTLHRQAEASPLVLDEKIAWLQTIAFLGVCKVANIQMSKASGEQRCYVLGISDFLIN